MARLAEASQRGEVTSLEQIELSQPFTERVILPMLKSVGDLSARFTPQKLLEDTSRKLEMAGNPGNMDASVFLASRFVVAAVFAGLMLMISIVSPSPWPTGRVMLVMIVFGT